MLNVEVDGVIYLNTMRAVLLLTLWFFINSHCLMGAELVRSEPMMGTLVSIKISYPDEVDRAIVDKALDLSFAEGRRLEKCLSTMDAESELSKINAAPAWVVLPLSRDMSELLTQAWAWSELSHGVFDPTLGQMTRLWKRSKSRAMLPKEEELKKAKARSGIPLIDFSGSLLMKRNEFVRLDLGAIGKGFVVDKMAQVLRDCGFTSYCIDTTSDVLAGDPPLGRDAWQIMMLLPDGTKKNVPLKNEAVSTSGVKNQWVELDGVRYAHIMDAQSGLGLKDARQATVSAIDATTADVCATIAVILGKDKAIKLFQQLPKKGINLISAE